MICETKLPARSVLVWGWLLLCLFTPGCAEKAGEQQTVAALNASNIQRLANSYSAFQMNSYGPGPADEAEFKEFIKNKMGPAHLRPMQIDPNNIDAVFISERDHQPFRIKYGIGGGPGVVNAVVFEEEGIKGMRQVGFNGGTVEEVGDVRYQQLWNGEQTVTQTAAPVN